MIVIFTSMKWFRLLPLLLLLIASCEIDPPASNVDRIDFLGSWTANEYEGDFAPQIYTVQVDALGGVNEVEIFGFYNITNGDPVKAEIIGTTLYIFEQTVNGYTFSGTGIIQPSLDVIDLSFTANDGGTIDQVKATWTR